VPQPQFRSKLMRHVNCAVMRALRCLARARREPMRSGRD
jgi:hypothetical protein